MFRRVLLPAAAITALLTVALIAAACGDDDDTHGPGMMGSGSPSGITGLSGMMNQAPAGSITVNLVNWAMEPSASTAKPGSVTFYAVHSMDHRHSASEGGVIHDLQVMRKKADGTYEMVGQVQGLKMGEAKALTLDLEAGDYELSCNVVEEIGGKTIAHYPKGMHTAFTVRA